MLTLRERIQRMIDALPPTARVGISREQLESWLEEDSEAQALKRKPG